MRIIAVAAVLLLSSSLAPVFAQEAGKAAGSNQPQTVPVQPEHTPQQSEQSRGQDRDRGEDVRVGRDWRAQQRDDDRMPRRDDDRMGRMDRMDRNSMGRMMDEDREHRTVGRDWRARPDDRADRDGYGRGSFDEDRPRLRRVKVCFEYENGDEYCRSK
jgi:hypothetical protein